MTFSKKYRGALLSAGYEGRSKESNRPLDYDFLKLLAHSVRIGDMVDVVHDAEQERQKESVDEGEDAEDGHNQDKDLERLKVLISRLSRRSSSGLHNTTDDEEATSTYKADEGIRNRSNNKSNADYAFSTYRPQFTMDEDARNIRVTDTGVMRLVFAYTLNREAKRINEIYLSELEMVRKSIILCHEEARKQGQELGGGGSTRDLEGLDLSKLTPRFSRKTLDTADVLVGMRRDETDNNTDHDALESADSKTRLNPSSSRMENLDPSLPFQSSYGFSSDEEAPPPIVETTHARRQSTTPRRRSSKARAKRRSVEDSLFEVAVVPRTVYSILSNRDVNKERKDITMASLKNALQVAYHRVSELRALRILNHTAIIKALKKWDKVNAGDGDKVEGRDFAVVEQAYPNLMPDYEICTKGYEKPLYREISKIYATLFCGGDLEEAKGKLTLAKGVVSKGQHDFSIGLILGVLLSVVTFLVYDLATATRSKLHTLWIDPSMFIFITVTGMLLYRWMWHLHVHFWSAVGINFRSLLMLPAKLLPDPMKAVRKILINTLIVVLCVLAFVLSVRVDGPAVNHRVVSILLWCLAMSYALYSYFMEDDTQGVFGVSTIVNCLSPVAPSDAKDRFAMDIATSLTIVFLSLVYSSCLIFNGIIMDNDITVENMGVCDPSVNNAVLFWSFILTVFPFLIRLCQCMRRHYDSGSQEIFMWPHGINSCKYGLSILVVCLGFFFRINISSRMLDVVVYVIVCSLSTLLASYFDVVGDWGLAKIPLVSSNGMEPRLSLWQRGVFLRHDLMYPNKGIYYLVMALNPLLRCLWTVSILNVGAASEQGLRVFTQYGFALEILRRFLWGLLKMEYDHITASSQYENTLLKKRSSGDEEDEDETTRRVLNLHFETDIYDSNSGEKNITVPLSLLGVLGLLISSVLLLVGLY